VILEFLNSVNMMRLNLQSSRETLDHYRNTILQRQVAEAYREVPFYRHLCDKHNLSPEVIKTVNDLRQLPIITKQDIRMNPNGFVNRR
jgi:phenylacetate-CoA ligase